MGIDIAAQVRQSVDVMINEGGSIRGVAILWIVHMEYSANVKKYQETHEGGIRREGPGSAWSRTRGELWRHKHT